MFKHFSVDIKCLRERLKYRWYLECQQKCYSVHTLSNQFSPSVRENLLSFHALTGCDTVASFSGYGKKKCWKIFQRQPDSVSSIGRSGELDLIEQFVDCMVCLHKQMWIKQDLICLSKKGKNWTCCLQPGMPSISTASEQTTKHALGCKQIKNRTLYPHPQTHLPGQRKPGCYHLPGQDYPQFQKPVFN